MPPKSYNFARTPDGLIMMADGLSKPQRWDGLASTTLDAGLAEPKTAVTMGSSGSGQIYGTYFGFQRFLDKDGNVSNLSPISTPYLTTFGANITNATKTTPIVVTTSAAHYLVSGAMVEIVNVQGNTAANGRWRITVTDSTHFSLNNSTPNADYLGGGCWQTVGRTGFVQGFYGVYIFAGNAVGGEQVFSHIIPKHGIYSDGAVCFCEFNRVTVAQDIDFLHGTERNATVAVTQLLNVSGTGASLYAWPLSSDYDDTLDARDTLFHAHAASTIQDIDEVVSSTKYTGTGTGGRRTVTDASNTTPIVITTGTTTTTHNGVSTTIREHGVDTGCIVRVGGVTGNTAANGTWQATRIDARKFSLDGSVGNGSGSNGFWSFGTPIYDVSTCGAAKNISGATNASPIEITTSVAHGYATDDVVNISGVLGNTAANGTWVIIKTSATKFTLNGSIGNGVYSASASDLAQDYTKIYCMAHGLADGATVLIERVTMHSGATNTQDEVNGSWTIKLVDVNSFALLGSTSTKTYTFGGGYFAGGGQFVLSVNGNSESDSFTIKSIGHGLTAGSLVNITSSLGTLNLNRSWYVYNVDTNQFSLRKTQTAEENVKIQPKYHFSLSGFATGTSSTASRGAPPENTYFGSGTWTAGVGTINYTNVEVPTDSRVVRRQILRNTAGQTQTFYVDVDTTDLVSTSFSSTKKDNELAAQEAVPLFDTDNNVLANRHGQPPDNKSILAHHLGRMFAAVDVPYSDGNVITTKDAGVITGAANASPIVITSANHNITSGTSVSISGVLGNTAANGTFTATSTGTNTFSLGGSTGNGTYTGGGEWRLASAQQSGVITGATNATPIVITSANHGLETGRKVTTASIGGNTPANGDFTITKLDNNRFMLNTSVGTAEYTSGGTWTSGASTITGIGTNWGAQFKTRFLYIVGQTKSYQIASVDTAAQTLTIFPAYQGTADSFAVYTIKPAPAERKLVYWSSAGLPESWFPGDAIALQEDGDNITGLMVKQSFLYILEKRHIYRFTFEDDPGKGQVFPASLRGCVNNRCWVVVEGLAYLMDESGIHIFDGGGDPAPITEPIQDFFEVDAARFIINWQASDYFHAVYYSPQETIRWFVSLGGQTYPRHAICYGIREKAFWLEQYAVPICSSAQAYNTAPIVYVGSHAQKVLQLWLGTLDGPNPLAGTVRGTVTAAGLLSITDSNAAFASSGLVGHPVSIVSGAGKGQQRVVASVSSGIITITQPWLIMPDTTSVYQLGGIEWQYRSGSYRYVESEGQSPTGVSVLFRPHAAEGIMNIRVFENDSEDAVKWRSARQGNGITVTAGDTDIVVDMTKASGFARQQLNRGREYYSEGRYHVAVEVAGVTNQDLTKIHDVDAVGATEEKQD